MVLVEEVTITMMMMMMAMVMMMNDTYVGIITETTPFHINNHMIVCINFFRKIQFENICSSF